MPPCAGLPANHPIWKRPGKPSAGFSEMGSAPAKSSAEFARWSEKEPPRKDQFDINDTILEVIALTRVELHRNDLSPQTRLADGLPPVQGDRIQLQQVILNLILNAVEAMSGPGSEPRDLLITTEKDEASGVRVAVRDSGTGLSPESVDRLFDAFYTTKTDGMGMGLSICRSIVEAHGGRVWATA